MNSAVSSYNMRSFDLSFQTSSGDTISLNLYDKESLEYHKSSSAFANSRELYLTRERGLSLHYEGNGLDELDKKEIAEALKDVEKTLSSFLSPKEMQQRDESKTTKKILDILSPLKEIQKRDRSNQIRSSLTDIFDNALKENTQKDTIKTLDQIFKSILEEFEPFSFYA